MRSVTVAQGSFSIQETVQPPKGAAPFYLLCESFIQPAVVAFIRQVRHLPLAEISICIRETFDFRKRIR